MQNMKEDKLLPNDSIVLKKSGNKTENNSENNLEHNNGKELHPKQDNGHIGKIPKAHSIIGD